MFDLIDEKKLKNIDLAALSDSVKAQEFKDYFLDSPGREHYRLLAYFSGMYSKSKLLDIGTYLGHSALALSYNQTNEVLSFDIVKNNNLKHQHSNIKFIIDNILNEKYINIINSAPFICLDINHDGVSEQNIYNFLKKINWKGLLFLDDIYLNSEMKDFWSTISKKKYDVTKYGHFTGSGLVLFE